MTGVERPLEPGRVLVGRIFTPHGVHGEVTVEPLSDRPERLAPGSELEVTGPDPDAPSTAVGSAVPPARLTVASSRPHRGRLLVRFEGIDDRDAAEPLRGHWLAIERSAVPPPPPGSWYHFELLGCRCVDREAGELGEVVELVEDGGGLLLVIDDGERRVPVPFVEAFLRRVDPGQRLIEVDLPPGLIETCTSTS